MLAFPLPCYHSVCSTPAVSLSALAVWCVSCCQLDDSFSCDIFVRFCNRKIMSLVAWWGCESHQISAQISDQILDLPYIWLWVWAWTIRCNQVTSPNPTQLIAATPTPTSYAQPCQATQRCTWPQYSTIQTEPIPTEHRTKHGQNKYSHVRLTLLATRNTRNLWKGQKL